MSFEKQQCVNISLNPDEALVFFDWLYRFNQKPVADFQCESEQRILWDIEAVLEKQIAAVFSENYSEILAKARQKIKTQQ